jgi:hypothetical protein
MHFTRLNFTAPRNQQCPGCGLGLIAMLEHRFGVSHERVVVSLTAVGWRQRLRGGGAFWAINLSTLRAG